MKNTREYKKRDCLIQKYDKFFSIEDFHNSVHSIKYINERHLKPSLNNHNYCKYLMR